MGSRFYEATISAAALAALALGGCAAAPAPGGAHSDETKCAVRLPPRAAAPPAVSAPERVAPPSLLVVHAQMPLEPLHRTLEARVPRRLSEGRVGIGPGGTVSYSVSRGALSLSVSRSALSIEAPIHARAEACRGNACYASCEPEALVVAEVPLMLRPDYRFEKTTVSLRFTRGCKVRALGGLLTLDITPTLEAQLRPELQTVGREIDEQLPELEARIAQAWTELSTPRALPLGGCFVLQPFGVIQGPFAASTTTLGARFAVQAHPELRVSCGAAPSVAALPPLQRDADLPREGVLRLGMVTPLSGLGRAIESAPSLQVSSRRLRAARAEVTSRGSDVDVQLGLDGDVCGDVGLSAALDFSGDGQLIRLTPVELGAGEHERLARSELEPAELTRALAAASGVTPLLSAQAFRGAVPPLAAGLSRPGLQVRAAVSSARPAGAVARGEELVAWLEARGALWLEAEGSR